MTQHYHYFVSYFGHAKNGAPVWGHTGVLSSTRYNSMDHIEQTEAVINGDTDNIASTVLNYQLLRECTDESCTAPTEQGEAGE